MKCIRLFWIEVKCDIFTKVDLVADGKTWVAVAIDSVKEWRKHDRKDDPPVHLAKWAKAYVAKPQPKWVHLFCHTLYVILMNWYLETELRHGTGGWDTLCEGFIMTFNFKVEIDCIDQALQEVKVAIFRILHDPLDLIQPDWRN